MDSFLLPIQVRWSDLDPNIHLRHSVYYDWGAFCRIEYLGRHGLGADAMQHLRIGPILFREECIFKKEIRLGDAVTINMELAKSRRDFSRWSIRHTIMKQENVICAILTVDGAWMDLSKRKLGVLNEEGMKVFEEMPRTEDFEWM